MNPRKKQTTHEHRRRSIAAIKAQYHGGAGRPKNLPDTLRYFVMGLFKALDKAGKLNEANSYEFRKMVLEKFPTSRFSYRSFSWYKHHYLKWKKATILERGAAAQVQQYDSK